MKIHHDHAHHDHHGREPGGVNDKPPVHSHDGPTSPAKDAVTDPVCGMKIAPTAAAGTHVHDGQK